MDFAEKGIEREIVEKSELVFPPVPAGLKKPTAALEEFNNFWRIDGDLIDMLAKKSPDMSVKIADYKQAITFLSDSEKSEFLLRFAQNEPFVLQSFLKRLDGLMK